MQQGDIGAFDLLYHKYRLAIYKNVFKLVKDATATEDILQEVFIKLWEKRQSITTSKPVAGWLFVVSYNQALRHLKAEQTVNLTDGQDIKNTVDPARETEIINDRWEILEKAIETLSPQKRKVFELCKLDGKTYDQAAKVLGISKHTVKEYLADAIKILKAYVKLHSHSLVSLLFILKYILA